LIQKAYELSQIIEGKLSNTQREIVEAGETLAEAAEKSRIEITQFFNEIRKMISDRETVMKQAISEQVKKHENLLRKKVDNVNKHFANVIAFYEEYERSMAEKDIQLLDSSIKRIEIIKKATMDVEKLEPFGPFAELNRDSELSLILKAFQQGKVVKETPPIQPQGGKNLKGYHVQANIQKAKGNNKEPLK